MTAIEVNTRLATAEPGSEDAAALARDLLEEVRYPAQLAIDVYLQSPERGEARKGMAVIERMGEFALAPLAKSGQMYEPVNDLWVVQTISEEFRALRRRCAIALTAMLSDKRPFATPGPGYEIETPAGLRVCDLAFILLTHLAERQGIMDQVVEQSIDERDAAISEFQSSRFLKRLAER